MSGSAEEPRTAPPAGRTTRAGERAAGAVWVWAHHVDGVLTDATWEALAEGRDLAGSLGTCLLLAGLDCGADPGAHPGSRPHLTGMLPLGELGGAGVGRVDLAVARATPGAEARADVAAVAALAAAIGTPAVLLVPGTPAGADLAARAAIRLDAAHLDDCLALRATGEGLRALRWACDDRVHEDWLVPADSPLVATLRPGTRGRPPAASGAEPPVHRHPAPAPQPRVRHLGALPGDPGSVPLPEAARIVAAGLGVGPRESLALVAELAELLGAAVGATRPLADRGWVPFERQIGTTGVTVSPRLYVALGISGALQHLSGIIGAETMIAVNTDRSCPMMSRATLAVVGDVAAVVPLLVALLRERRAGAAAVAAPAVPSANPSPPASPAPATAGGAE